jgi:hypothetical protein
MANCALEDAISAEEHAAATHERVAQDQSIFGAMRERKTFRLEGLGKKKCNKVETQ